MPSGSYILSASSSTRYSEAGHDTDIWFRAECSKASYSAYCPSIFSHLLQEEASLSKTLIYEYTKMSLRLILLLCSFNITLLFGSILGHWAILSQVHDYLSSIVLIWIPSAHGVGIKSNKILVGYTHMLYATMILSYLLSRDNIVNQRVCSQVGVYISSLVELRVPFSALRIPALKGEAGVLCIHRVRCCIQQ